MFTTGSQIETSGGSTRVVSSYDPLTKYLDVQVTSKRLIQFGETFYDNRETLVTIDSSEVGVLAFNDKVTGGSNTFISYNEPTQNLVTCGGVLRTEDFTFTSLTLTQLSG